MAEYHTDNPMLTRRYLQGLLEKHADKNFVKRLQTPEDYPQMDRPDLGPGNYSTHLMSYVTDDDGKAYVYPQIIQSPQTGALLKLPPRDAWEYAKENNQFIPFDSEDEASWFTENYKKIWDEIPRSRD